MFRVTYFDPVWNETDEKHFDDLEHARHFAFSMKCIGMKAADIMFM